jgi:hypothetical protein
MMPTLLLVEERPLVKVACLMDRRVARLPTRVDLPATTKREREPAAGTGGEHLEHFGLTRRVRVEIDLCRVGGDAPGALLGVDGLAALPRGDVTASHVRDEVGPSCRGDGDLNERRTQNAALDLGQAVEVERWPLAYPA